MALQPQDYLRTLDSIRDRCYLVYDKAQQNELNYFDIDETKLEHIIQNVEEITRERFGTNLDDIPPHSRLNHFGDDRLEELREKWQSVDALEQTRRWIDLVLVSVLVDAGAGQVWKYTTKEGKTIGRSEGLAIASLDMFLNGCFSSDPILKDKVDAHGLEKLSTDIISQGFQVSSSNPLIGLEGRTNLLKQLSTVLKNQGVYFKCGDSIRPGHLVDYLLEKSGNDKTIDVKDLWEIVISLAPMWPARITINNIPLGDVWPCTCLEDKGNYENLVPFHKLSQWLTYSLIDALQQSSLNIKINGIDKMTGLPEYRNGGLLVDFGLLNLKPKHLQRGLQYAQEQKMDDVSIPLFDGNDPLIVEWRALTVVYLDKIHLGIEKSLKQKLSLTQVLEAGTWNAGRKIAAKLRPSNGGPPIAIKVKIIIP
ncbi:unnamed protein product [Cunninghamella blakesleeana]